MKRKTFCILSIIIVLLLVIQINVDQTFAGQTSADQVSSDPASESNIFLIGGDDIFIDTLTEFFEIIGNAYAHYQDIEIQGDHIIYENDLVKVTGNAKLEKETMEATAQKMEINLNEELVTFTGDVVINWDGRNIQGEVITYEIKTGKLQIKKGRVKITGVGK